MGKTRTQKNVEYLQTFEREHQRRTRAGLTMSLIYTRTRRSLTLERPRTVINLLASKHHTQKQKALDTFNSMLNKFDTEALKEAGAQPDYLVLDRRPF
jgi:hypothetical protein